MRGSLPILLLTLLLLSTTAPVHADESSQIRMPGCDFLAAGLGPMIGWSFAEQTRGYRLFGGFEASGGCPWLRLSVGGVYRRAPKGQARERIHWMAWEPGLIGGGSLGFAHSNELGFQTALGAWLGAGLPVTEELRQREGNGVITRVCTTLSVGVRVRFGGGNKRTDLYVTPKVHYCMHPDFFT